MTAKVGQARFFAIVPVAVIYDTGLQHTDVRVYATLSERAGTKRRAWPGVRRIATDVGMSPTTVQQAIDRLEAAGHIEVDRSKGRANTYWLPMPGVSESGTPAYQELARTVSETGTELDEGTRRSSSSNFDDFLNARAMAAARTRQREGYEVRTLAGLAKTISADPAFVRKAKRVWQHRFCDTCAGDGFLSSYAPGAGMVQVECTEERIDP